MKLINIIFIFFAVMVNSLFAEHERVLLFLGSEKTSAQQLFLEQGKDKIETLLKKKNIPFYVLGKEGVPSSITVFPTIVFQNHLGNHIFQGKWNQWERLEQFIETAKYLKANEEVLEEKVDFYQKEGRSTHAIIVKVADVTGHQPPGYQLSVLKELVHKLLETKLMGYQQGQVVLQKTDRRYYFDFYPWVSEGGELYLSAKIFSQYHCKKPVWETKDKPFVGQWNSRGKIYLEAIKKMQSELQKQKISNTNGEAYDPISDEVLVIDFQHLPLPALEMKGKSVLVEVDLPLAKKWHVDINKSLVSFQISPPNDVYSGSVSFKEGSLSFGKSLSLDSLDGQFVVDMKTLTMGEADLDDALASKEMLHFAKFSQASFSFSLSDDQQIEWGKEVQLLVVGDFKIKEFHLKQEVPMKLMPIIEEGKAFLFLLAEFSLDLTKIGLEGASGDDPNRNLLQYQVRAYLKPSL